MPYLNLDLDYFSHPKVVRLVGLLGVEHVAIPIRLWCYVGKYHPATGMLQAYSVMELESVLQWSGQSGQLVEALLKIKLLEKKKDGYLIHDWLDHAGHLMAFKKRAITAAKKRWAVIASSNASSNRKPKVTTAPILTNPILPNHPKKREGRGRVTTMPDGWSLTPSMEEYGLKKGMASMTVHHEFESCKEHHLREGSRFTEQGWDSAVWRTWTLKWVSFGHKQVQRNGTGTDPIPRAYQKHNETTGEGVVMPDEVRGKIGKLVKGMGMPEGSA